MKKKQVNYTNILRKIAWKYHKASGVDWDDLFQEAMLGYLEAYKTYNPKRGRPTTHVWNCVSSRLSNYVKKERAYKEPLALTNGGSPMDMEGHVEEDFREGFSKEAQEIIDTILSAPEWFDSVKPREAMSRIGLLLMKKTKRPYLYAPTRRGLEELCAAFGS